MNLTILTSFVAHCQCALRTGRYKQIIQQHLSVNTAPIITRDDRSDLFIALAGVARGARQCCIHSSTAYSTTATAYCTAHRRYPYAAADLPYVPTCDRLRHIKAHSVPGLPAEPPHSVSSAQ